MFKPTQKLIDACFSAISNGNLEQFKSKTNAVFNDVDLSDTETFSSLKLLLDANRIDNFDLSEINIPYDKYVLGNLPYNGVYIESWTDTVIWPSDISVDPQQILQESKYPSEMTPVHKQATGKNINIAIIDQRLYLEHPEYQDRIKHYEMIGNWPENSKESADYHGSLVIGCAAGKTCGTAPDANIYYFAANNWPNDKIGLKQNHRLYNNMAIRRVLEINKTLPDKDKIRFLSCSWGSEQDQFSKESLELFDECEKNGIMVLGGFYRPERNKTRPCNKSGKTILMNGQEQTGNYIGIPTDCKTTPYYRGGYIYKKQGGSSSTFPYLAGVFACACQDNQIFFTRSNWQDTLFQIMNETAVIDTDGRKTINPIGVRERVTQIAREMEMNLIQQQSLQHE